MSHPFPTPALTADEVRALVNVAIDLADDFGVQCAVVVVDGDGVPRTVERPPAVPGQALERALASARAALLAPAQEDGDAAGLSIADDAAGVRGALGVAGGPDGFASAACRIAAQALGIAPPAPPRPVGA